MPKTTNDEAFALWMEKRYDVGSFKNALWTAIVKADLENRAKLAKGFPEDVALYNRWFRKEYDRWHDKDGAQSAKSTTHGTKTNPLKMSDALSVTTTYTELRD